MNLDYNTLLKMPQWQNRRKKILERDRKKCRNCGATTSLNVHHRQYHIMEATGAWKDPWAYEDKYLVTLCCNCHKAGHEIFSIPVFIVNK